jgi:hypothetical protein
MVARIYTGHEQRAKVAADALVQQLNVGEELAVIYAKCILHAVDHIPEKVRWAIPPSEGDARKDESVRHLRLRGGALDA